MTGTTSQNVEWIEGRTPPVDLLVHQKYFKLMHFSKVLVLVLGLTTNSASDAQPTFGLTWGPGLDAAYTGGLSSRSGSSSNVVKLGRSNADNKNNGLKNSGGHWLRDFLKETILVIPNISVRTLLKRPRTALWGSRCCQCAVLLLA